MDSLQDNNEDPPDKNSGKESTEDSDKKFALFDAVFGALELLALVFWMLSEIFHGRWIVHSLLLSVAAICFLCGGAHLIHKKFKQSKLIWSVCCLLCSAVAFLIFEGSVPEPSTMPKLTWAIEDRRFPELRIHLTNEGFFPQINEGTNVDVRAEIALVIPVTSTNEIAELRLNVLNNESTRAVDGGISVWASFSEPLKHAPAGPSTAWRPTQPQIQNGSTVWIEHPFKLKPKTANPLNDLFLYVPQGWPHQPQEGALILNLTTDGGRYPALVAKLMFPIVLNPTAPFLLRKGDSNTVIIPRNL